MAALTEGGPLKFKNQEVVRVVLPTNGSLADVVCFIADADYELMRVDEVHGVLGTDGGAVTLDVEKLTGTQAVGGGVTMLGSTFNMKATINTVVSRKASLTSTTGLTATKTNRLLKSGDRVALNFTGVLTALAGLSVTLYLKRLGRRTF
jgi:hypothetical protein